MKKFIMKWEQKDTLIYSFNGVLHNKIIGLDMDNTIIKTKSNSKFAKNAEDWQLWDDKVKSKLQELHQQQYSIVIFTNQKGISDKKVKDTDITQKIEAISNELNIPLSALLATDDDYMRKPRIGMWKFLEDSQKINLNLAESIYCGDAAGRQGKPKDFSDCDLKFALNLKVKFQTPEELFLDKSQVIPEIKFNPDSLRNIKKQEFKKNFDDLESYSYNFSDNICWITCIWKVKFLE